MKKLLIICAGDHGEVVAKIVEDTSYEELAFLNDNSPEAIGKIADIENFK